MGQPPVFASTPVLVLGAAILGVWLWTHFMSLTRMRRRIDRADARERRRLAWTWVATRVAAFAVFVWLLAAVSEYFDSFLSVMWADAPSMVWLILLGGPLLFGVTAFMSARMVYGFFDEDDGASRLRQTKR